MSPAISLEPMRAGVGNYLPLVVFFVIWWVSQRRARKNRTRQEGKSQASTSGPSLPPEATKDIEGISPMDVLRQMFFGGLEMPPMPSPQAPPAAVPVTADSGGARRAIPGWQVAQPVLPALVPRGVAAFTRDAVKVSPARNEAPPAPITEQAARSALVSAKLPRRELQRALAWSEVLAPPVALRDTSH